MLNSNPKNAEDLRIYQIIDANLDRAREGLRVLEDWARFGLGKEKYVEKIKDFRQILGKNHLGVYKQSRNHIEDKCKGLSHQEQFNRKTSEQIISSNSARVQEALRVIEEFSRLQNHELSKIASEIRYEIYTIEIDLLSYSKFKKLEEILKENDLYVITDQKDNLLETIEEILIAGVRIIQHRFKTGTDQDHLQEAIFDCDLVLASCGRIDVNKDSFFVSSEDIFDWTLSFKKINNLAIIFGREDRGLTNCELLLANKTFNIPTSQNNPSLNLSHAVSIALYELNKPPKKNLNNELKVFNLASSKEVHDTFVEIEEMLLRVGYLLKHTSKPKISKFKNSILRANTSMHEINVLRGIVHQINWFLNNSKKK